MGSGRPWRDVVGCTAFGRRHLYQPRSRSSPRAPGASVPPSEARLSSPFPASSWDSRTRSSGPRSRPMCCSRSSSGSSSPMHVDGSRRVYLVLPLLVLWANIHGSVVLGAALVRAVRASILRSAPPVTAVRLGAWLPRAAALVLAPWLCVLASPYGLALRGYYRSVLGNHGRTRARLERMGGQHAARPQPFFFALLLGGGSRRGCRPARTPEPFSALWPSLSPL